MVFGTRREDILPKLYSIRGVCRRRCLSEVSLVMPTGPWWAHVMFKLGARTRVLRVPLAIKPGFPYGC